MQKALSAVIARLPLTPGVYRFRDSAGQVLYLGRATVLRRRVASYWLDLRDRGVAAGGHPARLGRLRPAKRGTGRGTYV